MFDNWPNKRKETKIKTIKKTRKRAKMLNQHSHKNISHRFTECKSLFIFYVMKRVISVFTYNFIMSFCLLFENSKKELEFDLKCMRVF